MNAAGRGVARYQWIIQPELKPTKAILKKVDRRKDELLDEMHRYQAIIAVVALRELTRST